MTITDNIGFGLRMRGVPAVQRRIQAERALEQVQLGGFGNRLPKQLSGGQQQRVALARAIVFGPEILLLDEPFAALDRKLRETLQIELRDLTRRIGMTAVFVTHDQEEALILSDRIAVMNKGRIEQIGSPAALFEQPATRFVADFMGFGNMFDGVVRRFAGDAVIIETSGVEVAAPMAAGVSVGQLVGLGLRAERITLETCETAGAEPITGTITAALYQGTVATYRVHSDQFAGRELVVREATHADGHLRFAVGDRAKLSWPADAVRILLR